MLGTQQMLRLLKISQLENKTLGNLNRDLLNKYFQTFIKLVLKHKKVLQLR